MSFPRYPAYKDSGVEWLGEVPEHWEVDDLKHRCLAFPSNVDKKSYDDEASVRLCNYIDVYYNDVITSAMEFMSATASPQQIATFSLRAGDTIITKDSETADDIGISAFVPDDLPGVVCGYHLTMIRPRCDVSGAFVKRLFDAKTTKAKLEVSANGLTRVGLGQYAIDNLTFAWPPLAEQAAIATFLDCETAKIDALVAEQEKLIELLKEKRQAVISHAVTKGLDPSVPMKDSGVEWLGEVPAHWAVASLGYLSKIDTGSTPDRSIPAYWDRDVPWVKTGEVDWTPIHGTEEYISLEGLKNSACKVAPPGTLLMAMYGQGMTRGRAALLAINSAYNQACAGIQFGARVASDFALFYFMAAYAFIRDSGNETSQMNLSVGIISKFRLPVPPRAEQDAIVQYLRLALKKHVRLEDEARSAIVFLQERRSALISAAVTGQIDVRGLADRTGTPDLIAAHADSTPTQGRFGSESATQAA